MAPRSGGGGSSGGFGGDFKRDPGSRSGGGRGGGGGSGSGGYFTNGDYIPNPRYPGEDEDTPRVDIATINLISDDEDGPSVRFRSGGMRPVRLDRHEHKPRVTIVNTGPAIKSQADDEDKIEIDEKRSARPTVKQDPTKGGPGDEIQIKSEPDLTVTFRATTPDPSGEVEPISPNSRRKVKDRLGSPEAAIDHDMSGNVPEAKDEKKARRSTKNRDQKPGFQTEEDREEYARHLLDVEVLAKELGGMQGNLNEDKGKGKAKDAEGDDMMADATKPEDHRSGRLYLFQFPPVLPELYNPEDGNPRDKIDLTTTEKPKDTDADVEMGGTAPSAKGKGKLKDRVDLIGEIPPIKLEEEAVPLDKARKEEIQKGRTPYVKEEGCIGKLIVRKSGRVELSWGGVNLLVGRGVDAGFLTTGIVVDSLEKGPPGGGAPEGRALSMGQIMGKFVVTPDWEHME